MKKHYILFFLTSLSLFFCPFEQSFGQDVSEQEPLIMISVRKETSNDGKFLKLFYTEAFKRMGRTFVYKYYPVIRGGKMLSSGRVDGELAQLHKFSEENPNLIRVEEPILTIKVSAFATDQNIRLKKLSDLSEKDYIVEYVFGTTGFTNEGIPTMQEGKIIHVYHWSTGLKNLAAGRTDLFLSVERTVLGALKNGRYNNVPIYIAGIMEVHTLHTFFHKKHKDLALLLSEVLKKMKKEGIIEKYRRDSMMNIQ